MENTTQAAPAELTKKELLDIDEVVEDLTALDALAGEVADVDKATQPKPQVDPVAGSNGEPVNEAEQVGAGEVMMSAKDEATMLVEIAARGIGMFWPVLAFREETKKEAVKVTAPLLAKYNLTNTMMGKWSAEINAAVFFASLGYGCVMAVREAKAAEAEKREQASDGWFSKFFKWAK